MRYVVIGGVAAALAGAPHVTFDLDVTPDRDPENLGRLVGALRRLNANLYGRPADVVLDIDAKLLANGSAWKFVTDYGELDIALDPDGTRGYGDLRRDAVDVDVDGVTFKVASLADVIRSKEAAGRDRDRAVLPDLRRTLELSREEKRTGKR